jgi:hypothetical protein
LNPYCPIYLLDLKHSIYHNYFMENTTNRKELSDDDLVWNYCESYGIRSRMALIPHAPAVFVIARLEGIRGCAKYFSDTLSVKISKKQVEGVLKKIRGGHIKVTEGDIRLAAQAHPRAAAYFKIYPLALKPEVAMEDEEVEEGGEEVAGKLPPPEKITSRRVAKEAASSSNPTNPKNPFSDTQGIELEDDDGEYIPNNPKARGLMEKYNEGVRKRHQR